jgi:IS5 family transposase
MPFELLLGRTGEVVASLLRLSRLDWPAPDYSTLCRRRKTLSMRIPYRRPAGPLNLLVDSSGIEFLGGGEWQARKHGVQWRRQWRKAHLATDIANSDIRAGAFISSREPDSPVLPELPHQIPEEEGIATVTTDGACDTRRRRGALIGRGATPIIPIRRSGRSWTEDRPDARACGRNPPRHASTRPRVPKAWTGYHARCRADAKMRCLEAIGARIAPSDPDRQTAEVTVA